MFRRYLTVPGLPQGGVHDMAAPIAPVVEDLDLLHRRIQAALAALRGARDAHTHCPSIENEQRVERALATLDDLLGNPAQPREAL